MVLIGFSEQSELFTWGEGNYGQLGHGAAVTQYSKPLKVGKPFDGRPIYQIACGSNHTAALTGLLLIAFDLIG